MTLVPQGERLRAEVWVANEDVGFVRPAQAVKVKLQPHPFQKYGMLDGTVEQVSADASEGANAPGTAHDGSTAGAKPLTYKTLVTLERQALEADGIANGLTPGMQVSAEIMLGTRSVLEYLFSPVAKALQEAGRER